MELKKYEMQLHYFMNCKLHQVICKCHDNLAEYDYFALVFTFQGYNLSPKTATKVAVLGVVLQPLESVHFCLQPPELPNLQQLANGKRCNY